MIVHAIMAFRRGMRAISDWQQSQLLQTWFFFLSFLATFLFKHRDSFPRTLLLLLLFQGGQSKTKQQNLKSTYIEGAPSTDKKNRSVMGQNN